MHVTVARADGGAAACTRIFHTPGVARRRQVSSVRRAVLTAHFHVSGRVQGVFFRAATREQARLFGLTGWVRNTADGRVEGMVRGEPDKLADFRRWLHVGPEMARVLVVEWDLVPDQAFDGFRVR